jgi:(p)ppGpp synthase/HD superfamily hydrolase
VDQVETVPDRQLLAMKIHVVATNWGTEGLRRMLVAILSDFTEADRDTILRAERIAARLHARDQRSGDRPYIDHLLRVAIRIAHYYHVRDDEVLCAALLHDAVEDHPEELADLATAAERNQGTREGAFAVLGRAFSPRVARLVEAVTNPETDPALPVAERQAQYRGHIIDSLEREPWARVIKLSDFTDNGVGIMWTVTLVQARKLAAKYAPLVPQLMAFAARDDTPLDAGARERIMSQMANAERNFAAILETGQGEDAQAERLPS